MRAGPPEQAKRWARENGLPSDLHPGRGHTSNTTPPRLLLQSTPWARAFWMDPDLGDRIQAVLDDQGHNNREQQLLQPVNVRNIAAVGQGVNTVYETEFDDGTVGFHKPFESLDIANAVGFGHEGSSMQLVFEYGAWKLARDLGPPWSSDMPATVMREVEGRFGTISARQKGDVALTRPDLGLTTGLNVADLGFFDGLIGQQDRHPGNYLVDGALLRPIDHGYTFARDGDYMNWSYFLQHRFQHEPELRDYERRALQRLLASKDGFGLRSVIGQERYAALRARAAHMLNINGFKIGF